MNRPRTSQSIFRARGNVGKSVARGGTVHVSLLALVLLVSGCAGTADLPEDHYYRLATLPVEHSFVRPPLPGTLGVERIDTVDLLRDRALLYGEQEFPQRLKRHHYHFWAGSPPVLVRDQLVQYLRDRGVAGLVAEAAMTHDADLSLHLELRDFSRRLHADGEAAVRVELVVLAKPPGRQPPLLVRRYVTEMAAHNGSPAAAVEAFDRALGGIYDEIVGDLMHALGNPAPVERGS